MVIFIKLSNIIELKYRTWYKGKPPQRIKLEVPGWAGEKTHETGQPWHCKPFVDGATYGLEILYPYDSQVVVTRNKDNSCKFEFESTKEWDKLNIPLPFKNFAPNHYGVTSSLDIQTKPGYGILILPHPRFFTDITETVPFPSIGLIESDWWPKIFFIAFKSPNKTDRHIFRKGEGIAQVIVVPKDVDYQITEMTKPEAHEREEQEKMLSKYGKNISTRKWKDTQGHVFDNKYKMLSNMDKKKQQDAVSFMNDIRDKHDENILKADEQKRNRLKRRFIPKDDNKTR